MFIPEFSLDVRDKDKGFGGVIVINYDQRFLNFWRGEFITREIRHVALIFTYAGTNLNDISINEGS